MNKILIVEDEVIIRTALRKLLVRNKFDVSEAGSVKEATTKYNFANFDLVISDLRLPGAPGTDIIKLAGDTPVLIMTSYASLRSAVDSMRMGAIDYIAKPFDHDEMITAVKRVLLKREKAAASQKALIGENQTLVEGMIGTSQVMKELYAKIHKVAPTNATVLGNGETGTGKELVAQALHSESPRKNQPIISVNCAAIPDTLIEAELFGHEKGAFTGAANNREGLVAAADGGTLFLDEIGELPLEAQARLLRVLQEGEVRPLGSVESHKVNIRLVAATHRDLGKLAKKGLFREDLYYRVSEITLNIPPIREREGDAIIIAQALLKNFVQQMQRPQLSFNDDAMRAIKAYSWPGNVREIINKVKRAVIMADDKVITASDLELSCSSDTPEESLNLRHIRDAAEKMAISQALHAAQNNMAKAARLLGVTRPTLYNLTEKFGINIGDAD